MFCQYADQLYGPEPNGDDTPSSGDDVSLKLAQEVDKLRGSEEKPRRFQAVDTGTKHLVFVKCHPLVDPVLLVHHMLSSVKEAKEHKARQVNILQIGIQGWYKKKGDKIGMGYIN